MNPRTVRACKNVYKSDYLMANIFKLLDLDEQIKILEVSKRCEYILKSFVWSETCAELTLHKTPYVNIVIQNAKRETDLNEVRQSKVPLNHKKCVEFLYLNAKNIRKLIVHSEYYYYQQEVGVSFKNVQIFRNLTSLTYYRLILSDEQLQLVAKYCKKLQSLYILECFNEYLTTLIPGEHLNLDIVYDMDNLKDLEIHGDREKKSILKSYNLQKVFQNLNLQRFVLRHFTIEDYETETLEKLNNTIEILDMGIIADSFWLGLRQYLKHFGQLKELFITVNDYNTTFDVQIVDVLERNCPQLERLSLENCDLNVSDFRDLRNLQHLSLKSCGGLTFANFQQILGALKLKSFTLINTRILGTINHIYVAPSLEIMTIDTILFTQISDILQRSLNNFENLHTLRWMNGDINDNWIIDKCPQLRYLHIPNPYLLRRVVFTMKSLKELSFSSCVNLSWRFIIILIRNLSLERLTLRTSEVINNDKDIPLNACGIRTTLQLITIPWAIFKMAQEFWLDLMCLNEQLNLLIYGKHEEVLECIFLNELICHDSFISRIKTIKICGLKLGKFKQNMSKK